MKLETTPSATGEVKSLKISGERYRKHLTQRTGDRLTVWKRRADLTAGPPEERPRHTVTRAHDQLLVPAGILVSMMPGRHERIHRESAPMDTGLRTSGFGHYDLVRVETIDARGSGPNCGLGPS